jgi:hypothetical protein
MKKTLFIATLLLSTLTFAQTKTKATTKTVKKEVTKNVEVTKKAEVTKVVEAPKEGLLNKVNKTAKTVEDKANLPIINENNTVKKVKDGAIKVKEATGNK